MAVRTAQAVAVKWPLDSPPLMLDPRAQGALGTHDRPRLRTMGCLANKSPYENRA